MQRLIPSGGPADRQVKKFNIPESGGFYVSRKMAAALSGEIRLRGDDLRAHQSGDTIFIGSACAEPQHLVQVSYAS
jgi:hypothetical protein